MGAPMAALRTAKLGMGSSHRAVAVRTGGFILSALSNGQEKIWIHTFMSRHTHLLD